MVQTSVPGLTLAQAAYDSRGRLSSLSRGNRTYGFAYNSHGDLISIVDPLSRSTAFSHDRARCRETMMKGSVTIPGHALKYFDDSRGGLSRSQSMREELHADNYPPVRMTAWLLLLSLFACYLGLAPGTTDGRGYIPDDLKAGLGGLARRLT